MKKLIYCLGIYFLCGEIRDAIEYFSEPIDILLKKGFKKKFGTNGERAPNKGVNLTTGEVTGPMDRIGF